LPCHLGEVFLAHLPEVDALDDPAEDGWVVGGHPVQLLVECLAVLLLFFECFSDLGLGAPLEVRGELIHGAANRGPLRASVDVEAPAPTRPPLAQGEPRLLGARVRVGISDLDGELLVHASELTDPLGCEPSAPADRAGLGSRRVLSPAPIADPGRLGGHARAIVAEIA
jgi:hypothetical protein